MEKILQILSALRPEVNFQEHQKLIEDGILDSFDIITLIGELDEAFAIQIGVEDILPENFNSLEAIISLVERLQSEAE